MKFTHLFTRTIKENPKDEVSANAQLLTRAGFVYKNSAGIYTYLPLGWRVLQKIAQIIREEMNAIDGQEVFMSALVEKKYLDPTGRWDINVGFEVKAKGEETASFVAGWTHEEVITAIVTQFVNSYKDLPFSTYQIQTKFRNEARAKSGLLRGKEFMMKDMYSFHASEEDMFAYYDKVRVAYHNVFRRCGVKAYYTVAAGGDFTMSQTHEFQVVTDIGEDIIYVCDKCEHSENKEVSQLKDGEVCKICGGTVHEKKSVEVGNIFPLGTKYSQALNLLFIDEQGTKKSVVMGSYGIGLGRLMGTAVEVHHDEKGILWPESIAPFRIHLIALEGGELKASEIYDTLTQKGIEVLYDDRQGVSAGEKFADADLLGIPYRVVISKKTLEQESIEIKKREQQSTEAKLIPWAKLFDMLV